ncbi:hypothetical protein FGO68_gene11090 [Halteria grandinella]|uniref:Uncharacterized protein n=1 Tax=Halteria grandinella TaxID=5974 RepID=A0A8J8P117_HALGN|nr:hypothetical protein FGO68_gene11090 [Halteria grandinella]
MFEIIAHIKSDCALFRQSLPYLINCEIIRKSIQQDQLWTRQQIAFQNSLGFCAALYIHWDQEQSNTQTIKHKKAAIEGRRLEIACLLQLLNMQQMQSVYLVQIIINHQRLFEATLNIQLLIYKYFSNYQQAAS